MSLLHQAFSGLAQALLLAVLLAILADNFVKNAGMDKPLVAALLVLCLLVPVSGLTAAQWLRSVLGDTSILTWVILSNILAQRLFGFALLSSQSRKHLLLGVLLTGAVFFPLALGLGSVDPYHFGYAPLWMGVLIAMISIFAWFRGQRDLAVVVLLPLLAFNLYALESTNLWDYLLDPVLLIYALIQSAMHFKGYRLRKNA
jgi:hypothetical protein